VSTGPTTLGTKTSGLGRAGSESTNHDDVARAAASDRHSTSPFPAADRLRQGDLAADHLGTPADGRDLGSSVEPGVEHDQLVDQSAEQWRDGLHHAGRRCSSSLRRADHRDGASGPGGSSSATVHVGRFSCGRSASPGDESVPGSSGVNVMPVPHRARRRTHALNRRDHFQHASCGSTSCHPEHRSPFRGRQGGAPMCLPGVRSDPTPRVSPTKSLLLSAIRTGHPVLNKVF